MLSDAYLFFFLVVWRISWVKLLSKNLPLREWFLCIGTKISAFSWFLIIWTTFMLTIVLSMLHYIQGELHLIMIYLNMAIEQFILSSSGTFQWLTWSLCWLVQFNHCSGQTIGEVVIIMDNKSIVVLWQPEKKNPGLTPMDWTKLMVSAGIGLVSDSWNLISFMLSLCLY